MLESHCTTSQAGSKNLATTLDRTDKESQPHGIKTTQSYEQNTERSIKKSNGSEEGRLKNSVSIARLHIALL